MIGTLVDWSTRQRGVVLLLLALLLAAGGYALYTLPIEAVPDITGVQVQVNTPVAAIAPEAVEQRVTIPLERAMMGVPGLTEMRSITKFGLSQLTLEFEDGTDDVRARTLVSERLQQTSAMLPPDAQPTLAPISPGLGEIFYYTLDWAPGAKAKPADPQQALMDLYEAQEYIVKIALRGVRGVAEINSNGGLEAQFLIQPRPERLAAAGMTFGDLADVISQNVEDSGGGAITRGPERLTIRTTGKVQSVDDIARLPVKFAAGVLPLTVGDLAKVDIGSRIRTGAATMNGHQAVLGTVMMLIGENSRAVAIRVSAAIPGIRASLPPGMTLTVEYSRATLVDKTIGTVEKNLSEGAIFVCVVLLVVLGNWRAALLVALVIPTAFLFAIGGMRIGGVSGNLMSLGALDFGMIVDGAIVIVENSLRMMTVRRADKCSDLDPEERRVAVVDAARQVAGPMVFGVAIITLVYVPVLSLTGVEGKTFHPMAIAVMLALVGALAIALTLVPMLTAWFLRPSGKAGHEDRDSWIVRRATKLYRPALDFALTRTLLVSIVSLALAVGAFALFSGLGAEFVPKLDEGSITTMVYKPVGTSLDKSLAMEIASERAIMRRFPQVTSTFSRIGTSEVATDPMPPNENDLYIFYKPEADWPKGDGQPDDKPALIKGIEDVLDKQVPGQTFEFAQPIEMRFNEMLQGTRSDVSVKIFGEDYDTLEKLTAQIAKVLKATKGVGSVEPESHGRTSTLELEIDRAALARYNLTLAAANRAVSTALAGRTTGSILEEGHRHDVVVRMTELERASDTAILDLPIRVGTDGLVSLGRIATIKTIKTVDPIMRDNSSRRAALMVGIGDRDVESFVTEAQQAIAKQVKLPKGYHVEFQGQFRNLETARTRLTIVVPAALAFIFVLVCFALGSARQAIIVFTGIPLAVTGGIYALALRGMPFSITAAIGFIALLGIAMLNGLVMLSHINMLRSDGKSLDDAVHEGSLDRLRPVLATALVASLGFIPMAIATGPGAEVQRPLATVVIGGVITSTLLTLLLLPALYRWMERQAERPAAKAEPARHDHPSLQPAE
ncbi:efflux RND transporter permease subunit [Glacieibacterium megasporae]|uniref:efflux RND transporter permease subunit n=1 Tax=Glacieibacterium megasporae TaxID=2835787 RepID=UPI001C1E0F2C|nr:CusA/CzcA family heavy metal efflux RND transporter [Polymorphobacter megasporae]UAJ12321.1 CusA/CzcA family heavy metal efflux RND transporter [Polymorphobacter megasporae]